MDMQCNLETGTLTMLILCHQIKVKPPTAPSTAMIAQLAEKSPGLPSSTVSSPTPIFPWNNNPSLRRTILIPKASPPVIPRRMIPPMRPISKRPRMNPKEKKASVMIVRTISGRPFDETVLMKAAQAIRVIDDSGEKNDAEKCDCTYRIQM